MTTLKHWSNGNYSLSVMYCEGNKKPYLVMSSVWDGVERSGRLSGKFGTLRGAEKFCADFRGGISGKWV